MMPTSIMSIVAKLSMLLSLRISMAFYYNYFSSMNNPAKFLSISKIYNHIETSEISPGFSETNNSKTMYCYFLRSQNRTYNGYTVDLERRLRQHNGELKGGAKSTTRRNGICPWSYFAVFYSPKWDKIRAMQVEWLCKFPTRKKPRPKKFHGPIGRVKSLTTIVTSLPAAEREHMTLYLHADYFDLAVSYNISDHINMRMLEDLPYLQAPTLRQRRADKKKR